MKNTQSPDSLAALGFAYHFNPDGLIFEDSIIVRLPYTQDQLDSAGVASPLDLPVFYFSTVSGEWVKLTIFNAYNNYIFTKLKEFCYVSIFYNKSSTGIEGNNPWITTPNEFVLLPNYPNPFNPQTKITFHLPKQCEVSLHIYNLAGQHIRTLVEKEVYTVGIHNLNWDGNDDFGMRVPSGMYFIVMKAEDFIAQRKMILLH